MQKNLIGFRREQSELLSDMISEGVVAMIIKTAAMGLNPRVHCGKTLAQLQVHLEKMVQISNDI